jgi:hypothetical protein
MNTRPELTAAEKNLSYAKYYYLPMTPVPEEKLKILAAGPIDPKLALPIERRNELFKPGYFECEIGYCVMPDGTGYVANRTFFPGSTAEMFEWWFAWHALEDLRYRIWDPEDHFFARQQNREKALDQSLPMRERTWGTVHRILEDVGGGPEEIILNFRYPSELGYQEELVGTEYCSTMMCANGYGAKPGEGVAAIMTHMTRDVEGGIELRSRFWIGYGLVDGKLVKLLPEGVSAPIEAVRGLFQHNLTEFTHLAAILPKVYAEEKDNW